MLRSANPTLNNDTFVSSHALATDEVMTIQGTVNRSFILLLCVVSTASLVWYQYFNTPLHGNVQMWMIGGGIGGLVFALITAFNKTWAPVTAPVYALLKGLFLGGISAIFEAMYPGIIIQAVALTFGTFFSLLSAYKSGLIRATENFKLGVFAATGAIAIIYMSTLVLGFFGINVPFIHENGWIGIGFSLFVVVIAALNLVLDFDFIEQGAAKGSPKYMEWYAAFGLVVTLVWLYIEILRLLAKLSSRK